MIFLFLLRKLRFVILPNILENLKHDLKILLKWFRINSLQANPGKFQFMVLGKKKRNSAKSIINTTEIEESRKVVLLGTTIDNLLIVNEHIHDLCRTANYKLHVLRRICNAFIIANLIMPRWCGCFAEKNNI